MSKLPYPYVIAHRGASHYEPENTIAAFQKAYEMGIYHIELDCWLSKDEEIVVCHDETLDRTTDQKGSIKDLPLSEIKKAHAGFHFNTSHFQEVPTLREVFEWAKDKNVFLYIELKDPNPKIARLTVRLLELFNRINHSCIISFQHHLIEWIAKQYPNLLYGFSVEDHVEGLIEKAHRYGAYALVVKYKLLHSEFLKEAKAKHLQVMAFTVRTSEQLSFCLNYPIDAYFADQPNLEKLLDISSFS